MNQDIIKLASREQGVTESELRRIFGQAGVEVACELAEDGKLQSSYGKGSRPVATFKGAGK